jgi:non-lysosomal glucosylceramidase
VLAWTGFQWSGVTGRMRFGAREGRWFWANGEAWGTCELRRTGEGMQATVQVVHGSLALSELEVTGIGKLTLDAIAVVQASESISWCL